MPTGRTNQGSEGVEKVKQTTEAKNKAIVLEAFDTLFSERDYTAAERYWSPNYIQHTLILDLVVRVCSISSRASHQR